ncbi:MAG TPA: IPT/TIG domain-containing protein [Thermoanaerobaculia bacterium]|nr:IPT/TIG domain-containing protein [Thermoanaerobaculia bacterium]
MKSRWLPVLTLLSSIFPIAVLAQTPVIRSIEPAAGPTSGGILVAISGDELGANVACILPCPPLVTFDTTTVEGEFQSSGVIVVRTPAHPAGVVDVHLQTPDGRTVTAKKTFTYTTSSEASYDRLLLPIYLDGTVPGAHGSRWKTDFWLRHNGSEPLSLAPWPCPPAEVCPAVFPLTHTVNGGETLHNLPPFFTAPAPNPSRVLFASRNAVDDTSTNLRIYDESRGDIDAGAEVPVVRERDLRAKTVQLHAVPLEGAYRLHLRIYDLAQTEARFRVRVYEEVAGSGTGQPVSEFELVASTNQSGEFRSQAAYADSSALTDLLPGPLPRPALIRVEIEPLTAGSRFWPFISITNNVTQRVTLITPQ